MSVNLKVLFALTLIHFTGDFYSSFMSPLFPVFIDKLGLSLTQVGVITGVMRLMAFIIQPTVGYFADRYQTRLFIFAGLGLVATCIPLTGIAPNFWLLLFLVALGSTGSAMFHPSVTGMIPLYSGSRAGFSMSIFNTGGTLGFGIGPLFITAYVAALGLSALPFTMLFGLLALCYLYFAVPCPQGEGLNRSGFFSALRESLGDVWKIIFLIWLTMFLRAVVGQAFLTFIPVLYVLDGFSVVQAGVVYALFIISGTFSGLLSGTLSDRIGFKPVFLGSFLLMGPSLWFFLQLEGYWVYLGAIVAGGVVLAPLPLGVTMAQTLAPKGRSMVASIMMGFAYGLGGAISPLVGRLADSFSIRPVLTVMAVIPLLVVPVILKFPAVRSSG